MSTPTLHSPHRRSFPVVLGIAIGVQLLLSWLYVVSVSYFVNDDLKAIALANSRDLLTNMMTRIDVHRVPLVRASTYILHHLAPMNFSVAILFLLACHALTLVLLYQLLEKIRHSPINAWLIALYALNATVLSPLHWFAAGIHRFPLILLAVISCYAFVCFVENRRFSTAVVAAAMAFLATGFFIKAILIPLYWAAILFCLMDLRQWRKYRAEYLLIGATTLCFVTYVCWFSYTTTVQLESTFDIGKILLPCLNLGFQVISRIPLQIPFASVPPSIMIPLWVILLGALCWLNRNAWRPIAALFCILALNLVLLTASSRTAFIGALVMLVPRYYFELLFPITLFAGIALHGVKSPFQRDARPLSAAKPDTSIPRRWRAIKLAALIIYAAMGWYAAINYLHSGSDERYWQAARFERTLQSELAKFDAQHETLADRYIPPCFDGWLPTGIKLSSYLAWHGLNLRFEAQGKATRYVTDRGFIEPLDTNIKYH